MGGGGVGRLRGGSGGGAGCTALQRCRSSRVRGVHPGARGCNSADWPLGAQGHASVCVCVAVCLSGLAGPCVGLVVRGCVCPSVRVWPRLRPSARGCMSVRPRGDAAVRAVRCVGVRALLAWAVPSRGCVAAHGGGGSARGCVPSARGRRLRHRLSRRLEGAGVGPGTESVAAAAGGRDPRDARCAAWPRHGQPAGIWQEESESSCRAASVLPSPGGQLHGLAAVAG